MASKNLPVTIDQAIGSTEVLAYLKDPDSIDIHAFQPDPEEVRRRIEARSYEATSLDELLGESEVISGKSYVNKPFQVRSVEWLVSDIEGEGLPFYAVVSMVDYDGTLGTLTCGARSVVQKLAIMVANGWLPAWVKLTETATASGYKVLDLVQAPEPFPAA
jgi:hypothetical protein